MATYTAAADHLGTKADRPLTGRSTRLQRRNATTIAVKYHATDVITYHADGRIVLNSGGYQTSTTKARMNEYAPVLISQRGGLWYVSRPAPSLFYDGLTLGADGSFVVRAPEGAERAKRQLDRQVRAYIAGYCAAVQAAGELTPPSGGDCWGCYLAKEAGTGKYIEAMGYAHYLSHFEEGYYVPSLLWRALQGRGDPGFCWQLIAANAKRGDTRMLADTLRSFFRTIKPALLASGG